MVVKILTMSGYGGDDADDDRVDVSDEGSSGY